MENFLESLESNTQLSGNEKKQIIKIRELMRNICTVCVDQDHTIILNALQLLFEFFQSEERKNSF